jgi:hypothetical protein
MEVSGGPAAEGSLWCKTVLSKAMYYSDLVGRNSLERSSEQSTFLVALRTKWDTFLSGSR